jgi:D-xylose transport system ATP-binding protein
MKSQGLAILLISHNFDQVLRLSDQIWVMRQGDVMAGLRAKETSGDELVALITGAKSGVK